MFAAISPEGCRCGNNPNAIISLDESACNYPCLDDPNSGMCGGTCPETGVDAFNVFMSNTILIPDDADPPSPIEGPNPPTAPPPGTTIPPGPAPSLPPPQTQTTQLSSQTSILPESSSPLESGTATGSVVTFYTSLSTLYPFPTRPSSVLSSTVSTVITTPVVPVASNNPSSFRVPSASLPTPPASGTPGETASITFVRSDPSQTAGTDENFPIPAQVTGSKSSRYDLSILFILGEALLAAAIMA